MTKALFLTQKGKLQWNQRIWDFAWSSHGKKCFLLFSLLELRKREIHFNAFKSSEFQLLLLLQVASGNKEVPHPVICYFGSSWEWTIVLNVVWREISLLLGWVQQFCQEAGALFGKYHEEEKHENDIPCWGSEGLSGLWRKTNLTRSVLWTKALVINNRGSGQWWAEVQGTKLGWEIFTVEVRFGGWKDKYQWFGRGVGWGDQVKGFLVCST